MASLNTSINGPSIKSSYQGVINGPNLSSSSPTAAQWALFSVQAPLMNAFQDSGSKESVLKVENTGDGELSELIEDFNEGRIQFAFVKVKDPNTTLPKHVLVAWCGGGVPERTKGYFTSHLAAVAKILHGYHVQITARSDSDLAPESIIQKVADASGAKYSSGDSARGPAPVPPPPIRSKPVFTPTTSSAGSLNPLLAARNRKEANVDEDGWGADAPPVTRTQLEKVESAYKPTRVNIAELAKQDQQPARYGASADRDDRPADVVRGAYQPVGKVDIAAIRAQAKTKQDDRPTIVKGAYEPVGKVDIAAIRAKAQRPADDVDEAPKPLAERSAAFTQPAQSERLTSLPKPKVANKFGGASSFTGTKAPTPGGLGLGAPSVPVAAPVGAASRTFADQGGKTPAQLWAERKGKAGGAGSTITPPLTSPLDAQKSGSEWKSGYTGKSWATVQTPAYGRSGSAVQEHTTGGSNDRSLEPPDSPAGGVSALRDRFKDAAPISSAPAVPETSYQRAPPAPDASTRPTGGFALPGLPSRPPPPADDEEEEEQPTPHDYDEPEHSPIRVAMPVRRAEVPAFEPPEERLAATPLPARQIQEHLPDEDDLAGDEEAHATARGAATAVAEQSFGAGAVEAAAASQSAGHRALIQYDYEKAEDNEINLRDGEYVTEIEMLDEDWWMGTNAQGERGLFPSNYVEIVDDDDASAQVAAPAPAPIPTATRPLAQPEPEPEPEPAPQGGSAGAEGPTATALYDYEAAEDNELSFDEGAKITGLDFPDEDWWFGHYRGKSGLFPANYVQRDP